MHKRAKSSIKDSEESSPLNHRHIQAADFLAEVARLKNKEAPAKEKIPMKIKMKDPTPDTHLMPNKPLVPENKRRKDETEYLEEVSDRNTNNELSEQREPRPRTPDFKPTAVTHPNRQHNQELNQTLEVKRDASRQTLRPLPQGGYPHPQSSAHNNRNQSKDTDTEGRQKVKTAVKKSGQEKENMGCAVNTRPTVSRQNNGKRSDKSAPASPHRKQNKGDDNDGLSACNSDGEPEDALFKTLKDDIECTYDPSGLTNEFRNIVNNFGKRSADGLIHKGKYCKEKDGRSYMKIGDVNIFYDESVLGEIINFGLRSKISLN